MDLQSFLLHPTTSLISLHELCLLLCLCDLNTMNHTDGGKAMMLQKHIQKKKAGEKPYLTFTVPMLTHPSNRFKKRLSSWMLTPLCTDELGVFTTVRL